MNPHRPTRLSSWPSAQWMKTRGHFVKVEGKLLPKQTKEDVVVHLPPGYVVPALHAFSLEAALLHDPR